MVCFRLRYILLPGILFSDIFYPSERTLEVLENNVDNAFLLDRCDQNKVLRRRTIFGFIGTLNPKFVNSCRGKPDDNLGVTREWILFFRERATLIGLVAHQTFCIKDLAIRGFVCVPCHNRLDFSVFSGKQCGLIFHFRNYWWHNIAHSNKSERFT